MKLLFLLILSTSLSSVSNMVSHSEGSYVRSFREYPSGGESSRSTFRFSTLSYDEFRSLYSDSHVLSGGFSSSGYLRGRKLR